MSIKFKTIAHKNPQDLIAAPKYYATKANNGELTLKSLSALIAQMSTVSKTDIIAVLSALTEVIPQQLEEGKVIRLSELGSFNVSLSSTPSDTPEEVTSSNVVKLKLLFRPSHELKRQVESFEVFKEG